MLQDLEWPTLEERQWAIKATMLLKILHHLVCIPADQYLKAIQIMQGDTSKDYNSTPFFMLMLSCTPFFLLQSVYGTIYQMMRSMQQLLMNLNP